MPTSVPVGKTAELRCEESEGYPKPQYQWFRNNDELPLDPKTSPRFYNSSYSLDSSTGTLVSGRGLLGCGGGEGRPLGGARVTGGHFRYFRETVDVREV